MLNLEEIRRGIQTPTQSYVLPYKETEGVEALKIYESTGREAQEWQSLSVEFNILNTSISFNSIPPC